MNQFNLLTIQASSLFNIYMLSSLLVYFKKNKTSTSKFIRLQMHLFNITITLLFVIAVIYTIFLMENYESRTYMEICKHIVLLFYMIVLFFYEYIEIWLQDFWSLAMWVAIYFLVVTVWKAQSFDEISPTMLDDRKLGNNFYTMIVFGLVVVGFMIFYVISRIIQTMATKKFYEENEKSHDLVW